ncbi:MAG: hypothetical protein ACO3E9_00200 [Gemmataceae bacterium]
MSMVSETVKSRVGQVQKIALVVGIAGLAGGAAFYGIDKKQFFQSYLMSFIFWLAIGLGSLALLMIQHVAGGVWGFAMRRLFEAGAKTLVLLAVLFVPMFGGLAEVYEWVHPHDGDKILELKSGYLNVPFFTARQGIFFAVWVSLAFILGQLSRKEDQTADQSIGWWFKGFSGPGLLLFAITGGLASVDWAMSVDPHWYSTMYPVLFCFGCIFSAMLFNIVAMILLYNGGEIEKHMTKNHLRDVGSFVLGFVIFWTYLNLSQFLLIWSANLKEEVPYYLNRIEGGWQFVAILLGVGHFFLPFIVLLTRDAKRVKNNLLWICAWLLLMRFTDYLFLLGPSFSPKHFALNVSHLSLFAGIGGLWIWFFLWQWNSMPPIAVRDPRMVQEPIHGV